MPKLRLLWTPQGLIFTAWAAASILAGSVLTSFHQPFALPSNALVTLAQPGKGWRVLHLLSDSCGCSRKVSEYLLKRGPLPGASEQVLFIDAEDPFGTRAALSAGGFQVSSAPSAKLRSFGVTGVPLLVFISPSGEVRYMGGYGVGSYKDADLWTQIQEGRPVKNLPVLGCAVGQTLRREVDPLAWKYR